MERRPGLPRRRWRRRRSRIVSIVCVRPLVRPADSHLQRSRVAVGGVDDAERGPRHPELARGRGRKGRVRVRHELVVVGFPGEDRRRRGPPGLLPRVAGSGRGGLVRRVHAARAGQRDDLGHGRPRVFQRGRDRTGSATERPLLLRRRRRRAGRGADRFLRPAAGSGRTRVRRESPPRAADGRAAPRTGARDLGDRAVRTVHAIPAGRGGAPAPAPHRGPGAPRAAAPPLPRRACGGGSGAAALRARGGDPGPRGRAAGGERRARFLPGVRPPGRLAAAARVSAAERARQDVSTRGTVRLCPAPKTGYHHGGLSATRSSLRGTWGRGHAATGPGGYSL
mmetsp:Transcript_809/g.1845  ORF Transcript_809/g.1845 Transcript_809/m.1845 type:complete len:338 (-) Transcript_809:35-1048(-)